ncbi:MAG: hypothetical protein HQL21_04290 [Candidatus Omnitrophica bacterium]|nr:hypothetical protein [Candidatus Omnitrophota bacterium]
MPLKILRTYWFILIIPGIFTFFSFLTKSASGPFWQYCDPSYQYLFNSLKLIAGLSPTHTDHPGTPLQILGMLVIWCLNIGRSSADIVTRVLLNPELYLHAIYASLPVLFFATSVMVGVYAYHKTQDKMAALLPSLALFCVLSMKSFSYEQPYIPIVANVYPETLLMSIINLFCLGLFGAFFAKTTKRESVFVLLLALICGLGVATKLIFLPLLIVPLIIASWRMKFVFLLVTGASFFLWTSPIMSQYPRMWGWITGLITHSGRYGGGTTEVINVSAFFMACGLILLRYWFIVLPALSGLVWGVIRIQKDRTDRWARFLWATSLGVLAQFFFVAKHFDDHYLVPGIGLFSALLVFLYLNPVVHKIIVKRIAWVLVFVAILYGGISTVLFCRELSGLEKDLKGFREGLQSKYPGSILIGYYGHLTPSPEYALSYGDDSAFSDQLSKLYPKIFCLEQGYIWHFKSRFLADDLLAHFPSIIFIGEDVDFSRTPYSVRLLEKSQYFRAYRLTGSTEREAEHLFLAAKRAFAKGDYGQAFVMALRSRELHLQPDKRTQDFIQTLEPYFKR